MGTIDTLLRVKADASQAVSGLKPLQTSLDSTAASAQTTEAALKGLDGSHKVTLNTQAIENAQSEISRLRASIRDQLALDINADTRPAQTRIRQLQSSIRTLEQEDHQVEVNVEVSETGAAAGGALRGLTAGLAQGATGLIPIPGALSKITSAAGPAAAGLEGVGGASAALGAGAAVAGPIALAAGVGLIGIKFGQAAADVETSVVQLQALTGDKQIGTQLFEDLQKWAASTPFAIDDATEAAKRLLAAGVEVKDVNDQLSDMGNIASATGVPLAQIATVFAQMESKGKATFEELQQLAEAGVPVWSTLAKSMGLTVAEVQKLATEGKLSADAIDLARESVAGLFPTAMADQAKTYNGQMSTLNDTLDQTEQSLGRLFLPLMTETVGVFNDVLGPTLSATQALGDFNDEVKEVSGSDLLGFLNPLKVPLDGLKGGLHLINEGLGDNEDAADGAGKKTDDLGDIVAKVQGQMTDGAAAAKAYEDQLKGLQQAAEDATQAFADIGVNIRTKVSFLISQDDFRDSVAEAVKGGSVTLPADLNITQISGLDEHQKDLINDISSFAQAGLEEGARRAELDPNFDSRSFGLKLRQDTRGMLISAGVDRDQVDRVLDNVVGLPRKSVVNVSANMKDANRALDRFTHPKRVPVIPYIDEKTARAAQSGPLANLLKPKKVSVAPTTDQGAQNATAADLNQTVAPGGKPRNAIIKPMVDAASLVSVQATLRALTEPATKVIKVHMEENPTGDTIDVNRFMNSGLAGASRVILHGPAGGTSTATAATTSEVQLAPRQTPVKVYLDGQEIADGLTLRAGRLSSSGRRTA